MATGDVQDRYNRTWLQLEDDRKVRGFDQRSAERRAREFVADNGNTVTAVGDNVN